MHVALSSPAWPASRHPNGIVTYVECLRTELIRQGHKVSVFSPIVDGAKPDADVHLVTPSAGQRLLQGLAHRLRRPDAPYMTYARSLADKINAVSRRHRVDVLEMEETFGWSSQVQALVQAPVVVKLHGPAFMDLVDEDRTTAYAATRMRREARSLRDAPIITSPARSTLDAALRHCGAAPGLTAVVPNPAPPDALAQPWTLQGCDPNTLLFVGRFDKRKGADIALRAFRNLLDERPDLGLVVVGPDVGITEADGTRSYFTQFRDRLFAPAQRDRIRYLDALPRPRIAELRRAALVTLVPSRWDNQPNTALEAMMQGCPLVTVDTGGMAEIVQHGVTGLVARPGDIGHLCEQVRTLLDAPDLAARLGARARDYVTTRHCPRAVADQTLDVYRRAIALRASAGRAGRRAFAGVAR